MRLSFLLSLCLLASQLLNAAASKYEIKIKLSQFNQDTIVLGHRFNASFIPKDTAVLDDKGNGVFTGDEELPHGMYLVYLPDKKFFDLLISDDQFFFVENDTSDFVGKIKLQGSEENTAFYNYQKFIRDQREKAVAIQTRMKAAVTPEDSIKMRTELEQVNQTVESHVAELLTTYKGTFFGVFLLALQEVKVPGPPLGEDGKPVDPLFQYKYYKSHYFDNFDVSDVRLLRTPFYEQKIMTYIEKVAVQIPDSLILEVDMLIEKSRTDPQLFRFMLITLFNYFAKSQIMGMDAVYIHLAEKYYIPEADWSDREFITKLEERVTKSKPTLIGQIAEDFQLVEVSAEHFILAADDAELKKNPYVGDFFQLHDIKAKFTILYFWECDCGHCKKSTPELYKVCQRLKSKDVKVIAVHMLSGEEGKEKWVDYINENGFYDWKNCWNPYDYNYKIVYDIMSTPQLFLLDENKKILAKRIAPDQAEQIIESMLKNQ